jgi:hypothetical protein
MAKKELTVQTLINTIKTAGQDAAEQVIADANDATSKKIAKLQEGISEKQAQLKKEQAKEAKLAGLLGKALVKMAKPFTATDADAPAGGRMKAAEIKAQKAAIMVAIPKGQSNAINKKAIMEAIGATKDIAPRIKQLKDAKKLKQFGKVKAAKYYK